MPFATVAVRLTSFLAAALVAVAPAWIAPTASADPAATAGSFTLSPTSLSFGANTVSDTKVESILVTNTSNGSVQVSSTYPAGPFFDEEKDLFQSDCYSNNRDIDPQVARILAPGDNCRIWVSFHPEVNGYFTRKMTISLTPATGTRNTHQPYESTTVLVSKTVNLTGNAALPTYTVSPTSGSYGNVTLTNDKVKTFTLKNTSKIPLVFDVAQTSDFSNFGLEVPDTAVDGHCVASDLLGDVSWSVAPGATCDFTIDFVPHTDGNWKATYAWKAAFSIFSFRSPGAGYQDHAASDMLVAKTLNVNGTGVAPKVSLSPATLQFGSIASNGTRVLGSRVTNKSDIPLVVRAQNYAGTEPFQFVYLSSALAPDDCQTSDGKYWVIGPGQSCLARVLVQSPTKGSHSGKLQLQVARATDNPGAYQTAPLGNVLSLVYVKATTYGTGQPG